MAELTPDPEETRRLLERASAGDRQAVEQLFTQHRSQLCRFVELHLDARLRARVDPSDVVQEAQLEAFRRLEDFLQRQPMPFALWLRKTVYERLLKVHRRHLAAAQRAVGRELQLPDWSSLSLFQQLAASGSTPSRVLSRQEVSRRVSRALTDLPATDREILLMRNIEGLSYQEVSYLLDIDAAAARKRYGRALLRFRQLLIDQGLLESQP
jgi:RNA polymerase sigma-70 factor (ECF subfamily)